MFGIKKMNAKLAALKEAYLAQIELNEFFLETIALHTKIIQEQQAELEALRPKKKGKK